MNLSKSFLSVLIVLLPELSSAQQVSQKHFSLFAPVPKDKLREMETDRPDVTESAITVDAGHFQYESDLCAFEREQLSEASLQKTFIVNKANLKIGLTGTTSLQVGVGTYIWQEETNHQSGEANRKEGFGDINIRIKQNLLGNDKGNFALALLPYIKFPTATYTDDSKLEEGIILPMQLKLPGQWKLGMQLEVDHLKDKTGNLMHMEYLQSFTVSHEIVKSITGIAETYLTYDFKEHHYTNYLNAAIQIELARDLKLDGGLNYGLQHDALRRYFCGLAIRI
jgi:hypothetical protein